MSQNGSSNGDIQTTTKTKWDVDRAKREKASLLHPMGGCDLDTLLEHFRQNSNYSLRSLPQRITSVIGVALRHPFTVVERLAWSDKVRQYKLPQDPIFIVGHWRSGTTHLHNLLSKDPQFAFLDFGQTAMPHNLLNESRKYGRWLIAKALPKKRGYDNVELTIDSPQEEEMALGSLNPLGYYSVYYFPQDIVRHFERTVFLKGVSGPDQERFKQAYKTLIKKLSMASEGRQLLLKNPPSTARLLLLKELFPKARFIYIHRNPYEVFASSLNRYYRLMSAFAWQNFDDVDFEEMVYFKYQRLLGAYLEQREQIPKADRMETSYEAITERPMEELTRIYDYFKLPNKDSGLEAIAPYVESKKGYKRNAHEMSRHQVERIQKDWAFSLKEWPHEIPDLINVV